MTEDQQHNYRIERVGEVDVVRITQAKLGYPDLESADYTSHWQEDAQLTGKDIVRFHTVYWTAFLL